MKTKQEEFEVLVPNLDGTGIAERVKVTVPLRWDEELEEWLLTPEAHEMIEDTKARHMGLLLPAQFKELRQRYDFSQKEMGELFQVGEKSWTRWESGKHRPSRSINLLIRALYEGKIPVNYLLKRAGKPPRQGTTWPPKVLHILFGPGKFYQGAAVTSVMNTACYSHAASPVVGVRYESSAGKQSLLSQFPNLQDVPLPTAAQRLSICAPTHTYPRPSLLPTVS